MYVEQLSSSFSSDYLNKLVISDSQPPSPFSETFAGAKRILEKLLQMSDVETSDADKRRPTR